MRLKNKVAIITGAGGGIGRATALLFAEEGAKIVVADCVFEAGNQTVSLIKENKGEATFVEIDVTKASDAERMVRRTLDEYGKLDILFNNAGTGGAFAPVIDYPEDDWDRVISVNLKGVFLCSKYSLRAMLEAGKGVIINNASAAGLVGVRLIAGYSASKGGVVQLTKTMALEYASKNIRVNCICPGLVNTPLLFGIGEEAIRNLSKKAQPLGRLCEPEEIARAALYLASDESSFVTGAVLVVDGGWTAK